LTASYGAEAKYACDPCGLSHIKKMAKAKYFLTSTGFDRFQNLKVHITVGLEGPKEITPQHSSHHILRVYHEGHLARF
jgi:hypothetical protein